VKDWLIAWWFVCTLQYFSRLTKTVHLVSIASSSLIHKWQHQHELPHARLQLRGRLEDVPWTQWILDVMFAIVSSTPIYKPCHTSREHHITMKSSDVLTRPGHCGTCGVVTSYFVHQCTVFSRIYSAGYTLFLRAKKRYCGLYKGAGYTKSFLHDLCTCQL